MPVRPVPAPDSAMLTFTCNFKRTVPMENNVELNLENLESRLELEAAAAAAAPILPIQCWCKQ